MHWVAAGLWDGDGAAARLRLEVVWHDIIAFSSGKFDGFYSWYNTFHLVEPSLYNYAVIKIQAVRRFDELNKSSE